MSSFMYVARSDTPPETPSQDLEVFEHLQEGWSAGKGRYSAPGDVTYQYPHFYITHPPTPPLVKHQNTSDRGFRSDSGGSVHQFPVKSMATFGSLDSGLPFITKLTQLDDEVMYKFDISKSLHGP